LIKENKDKNQIDPENGIKPSKTNISSSKNHKIFLSIS